MLGRGEAPTPAAAMAWAVAQERLAFAVKGHTDPKRLIAESPFVLKRFLKMYSSAGEAADKAALQLGAQVHAREQAKQAAASITGGTGVVERQKRRVQYAAEQHHAVLHEAVVQVSDKGPFREALHAATRPAFRKAWFGTGTCAGHLHKSVTNTSARLQLTAWLTAHRGAAAPAASAVKELANRLGHKKITNEADYAQGVVRMYKSLREWIAKDKDGLAESVAKGLTEPLDAKSILREWATGNAA